MSTVLRNKRMWFAAVLATQGVLVLAANWIGGNRVNGHFWFGAALAVALALGVLAQGDVPRALRGERDERMALLDLRALAVTYAFVFGAIFVLYLVEAARGNAGSGYAWLLALGGFTYPLVLTYFNRRG